MLPRGGVEIKVNRCIKSHKDTDYQGKANQSYEDINLYSLMSNTKSNGK